MRPRSSSSTRRGLLGLAAAGATGLAGCGAVGRDCPAPSTAGAPGDWPQRFHDAGRTSAAPTGPGSLTEQWVLRVATRSTRPVVAADVETGEVLAARTFDYQVNRPPVFADGRAFVRSLEYVHAGDGARHVADRIHALG